MPPERTPSPRPREVHRPDDVHREQREANEKLVLEALRAHEAADDALDAQQCAVEESDELKVLALELRTVAEFRERLIGIIGHDLRNPLNTMVMAAGLLISRGSLTEEDARLTSRIVVSGHRMSRMIGQLVEFTRARLGAGFNLALAPRDLGEICKDIADELRISTSADVRHSSEGDVSGTWDADRLAEVVSNIAGNAVDHATRGTSILIHTRDDGGEVVAEITNHGAEIPADLIPSIFTAFGRAGPQSSATADHLGLGLYIASEIVRAHGGTLGVRSSDGTTTFTMRLPRVAKAPASR